MSHSRRNLRDDQREILKILEGDESEEEYDDENVDEYEILANVLLEASSNTKEVLSEESAIITAFGKF